MKITISHYDFIQRFPDEAAARSYLEHRRWHGKPVCPHCNSGERVQVRKVVGYFRCLACKEDFTVRTGTIFERSHIPLDKWLYAMYLLSTARKGISSMQISKELGTCANDLSAAQDVASLANSVEKAVSFQIVPMATVALMANI